MIFINFVIILFSTIIIEIITAYFLGYRKSNQILIIALINVITNPIINYILILNNFFHLITNTFFLVIILEIMIIVVEWRILNYAFSNTSYNLSFLTLSLSINISSFLIGTLIFGPPFSYQ